MTAPLDRYADAIQKTREHDARVTELRNQVDQLNDELWAEENRRVLRTIDPEVLPGLLLEIHQRLTALEASQPQPEEEEEEA